MKQLVQATQAQTPNTAPTCHDEQRRHACVEPPHDVSVQPVAHHYGALWLHTVLGGDVLHQEGAGLACHNRLALNNTWRLVTVQYEAETTQNAEGWQNVQRSSAARAGCMQQRWALC
jgi:hypothetical protein